jgi:cytidyltransferase-like protein
MKKKKVFVSGCFDLLHSGHIAFFEEASHQGDLFVGIGSDKTIQALKNRTTVYTEMERLYLIKSIRFVHDAWINSGSGNLDFVEEIKSLKPDILFVNEDGDHEAKKTLCDQLGIQYRISKRLPKDDLPERSTTGIRSKSTIPYRLDLAGGWLDQPFVSKHHPGPVITISIEPTVDFNDRSGMSSSTRNKAIEIWGYRLPDDNPEKLAKILFSFENPPGKEEISGSQDSIGIVYPALNYLYYSGNYWPDRISTCRDNNVLDWLEKRLHFLPLSPRKYGFNVLGNTIINQDNTRRLAVSSDKVWNAILQKDQISFGKFFRESYEAQVAMFPNMVNDQVLETIEKYRQQAFGWKLSGAGGGGYLILISDKMIEGTFGIKIRKVNSEYSD